MPRCRDWYNNAMRPESSSQHHTNFPATERAKFRAELLEAGVVVDPWMASAAQHPAFGLNVACSWPFPEEALRAYARFAEQLAAVPGLRVYEPAQTHVTLATLMTFQRHLNPGEVARRGLESLAGRVVARIKACWSDLADVGAFDLVPEPPVLTRRACLLPWVNPGGEVDAIRRSLRRWFEETTPLGGELRDHGWNVPGIIHSTVGRFEEAAASASVVAAAFDRATAGHEMPPLRVREIQITAELSPYMARGEVRERLVLARGRDGFQAAGERVFGAIA